MKSILEHFKNTDILSRTVALGILLFPQQLCAIENTDNSNALAPKAEAEVSETATFQKKNLFEQINSLDQIFPYINSFIGQHGADYSEILVVLDWDNTVSRVNGCSLPLREGRETQDVVNELVRDGVPVAIMTARFNGSGIFEEGNPDRPINEKIAQSVIQSTLNMERALGFPLPNIFEEDVENSILPPDFTIGQYPYKLDNKHYHFLIRNSIIFAGGPSDIIKGGTLKILLESKFFKKQPKYIIFVDNYAGNVNGVLSALSKMDIHAIGLFFPEEKERDDRENCTLSP